MKIKTTIPVIIEQSPFVIYNGIISFEISEIRKIYRTGKVFIISHVLDPEDNFLKQVSVQTTIEEVESKYSNLYSTTESYLELSSLIFYSILKDKMIISFNLNESQIIEE